jgi:uncharacterized membrane protein HdeD (DUF308 family)
MDAEFPQRLGAVADSRPPSRRESGPVKQHRRSAMDTVLKEAQQMSETELSKVRWSLGLSGVLSIALGVAIIIWPGISLYALVIVFGAYALARGVIGLGAAFSGAIENGRGWLIVSSLAGIAVGVLVFLWTGMSALALLYVIASYAIVLGIIAIVGAFWLPLDGGDSVLLALTGLLSDLFGVVMFAKPGDGALALLALIAAYTLITGIAELTVAIGGKRLFNRMVASYKPQLTH